MKFPFFKYQGSGNDFVMLDNRQAAISLDKEEVARMCHRRFGIGADGLILIEAAAQADFYMRYFNADGGESSFCGNGGRCAVSFAHFMGIISDKTCFEAADGFHEGFIDGEDFIRLKMCDTGLPQKTAQGYFLDTGSPHLIVFCENPDEVDVFSVGRNLRQQAGPQGVNVNFVSMHGDNIRIRTYERGVEDETLSCGTGVTASVLTAQVVFGLAEKIRVETMGGILEVSSRNTSYGFESVFLSGPARQVYAGSWQLVE
jgi:diaminopimelate epimerase